MEELHHFHLLILAAAIKEGLDYEEMGLMDRSVVPTRELD
jgi:hypothetical protein